MLELPQNIEEINERVNAMCDAFDAVILDYVSAQKDDDGLTPFVVTHAIASIITKLGLIMECKRENVFNFLNEIVPSNEDLEKIKEESNIPDNLLH